MQPVIQRQFSSYPSHPQMSAPPPQQQHMYRQGPSPNTQGLFSTYYARIKHSQDNALLLPLSYITSKRQRLADDSDDDFEELLEGSDNDDNNNQPSTSNKVETAVAADAEYKSIQEQNKNLVKIIHSKNIMLPPTKEILEKISDVEEVLVPIRLDIDLDEVKLRDVFVWNMNEQYLTPEMFAELLCEDLQLEPKFVKPISENIRSQVVDFEAIHEYKLPNENQRVEINLDLQIGKVNLRDQFEWDLNNVNTNAPEVFSRQLAAELGLGGEYVGIIAHGIREQLFKHRKGLVDEYDGHVRRESRLDSGFRKVTDADNWAPRLEVLSNDELEKLLIAQERNIRRLRRETRFTRSSRRTNK